MKFWHRHKWELYEISCAINSPESSIRYAFSLRKCTGCGKLQKDTKTDWTDTPAEKLDSFNEKSHKIFNLIKDLF